ncbi:hypothetical protein OV450_4727 [Actinobacteria bacterium OV450]|nr:hypothetical protein OV450_4727 [Actinobacteria bacterium OV450]
MRPAGPGCPGRRTAAGQGGRGVRPGCTVTTRAAGVPGPGTGPGPRRVPRSLVRLGSRDPARSGVRRTSRRPVRPWLRRALGGCVVSGTGLRPRLGGVARVRRGRTRPAGRGVRRVVRPSVRPRLRQAGVRAGRRIPGLRVRGGGRARGRAGVGCVRRGGRARGRAGVGSPRLGGRARGRVGRCRVRPVPRRGRGARLWLWPGRVRGARGVPGARGGESVGHVRPRAGSGPQQGHVFGRLFGLSIKIIRQSASGMCQDTPVSRTPAPARLPPGRPAGGRRRRTREAAG